MQKNVLYKRNNKSVKVTKKVKGSYVCQRQNSRKQFLYFILCKIFFKLYFMGVLYAKSVSKML